MISNYFKLAWRNLKKNKTFSFINIFGLATGLTCCILISLYVVHETSYDRHHVYSNRTYLLGTDFIDEGKEDKTANTSAPLGKLMQQEYPEIQTSARLLNLFGDDKTLLQAKGTDGSLHSIYEQKAFLADSNIFQLFTYSFKEGDPKTALTEPNSVVINEEIAHKLFGDQPALGRVIRISSSTNGDTSYRITGVVREPQAPTHLNSRIFMTFRGGNMDQLANNNMKLANNNMFYTYVLLKEGADPKKLEQKFPDFVRRHLGEDLKRMGKDRNYFLTPITGVYLSGIKRSISSGSKTSLFILSSIALLTLLIACINFMNLSTASSAKRAAEVGVRKVLGAQKTSLLRQFLGEALLLSLLALVFAIIFCILCMPLFEEIAGKKFIIPNNQKLILAVSFFLLAVGTGILAGSYPAFYLSSFKPIKVLKCRFSNSLAAVSLRKGLVVFQFMISIVLITASLIIANQMRFMREKDLGFQKDQQIIVPLRTAIAKSNVQAFKNALTGNAAISSVGSSMAYPGIFNPQDWLMYPQGKTMDNSKTVYINLVDNSFLQTLGVHLLAGRLFSEQFLSDTLSSFVINEQAVKQFGFGSPQDAIGKWMAFDWEGKQRRFTIIGVVKNFHFKDLHEPVQPFAFRFYNDANVGFNYMIVHSNGKNIGTSLAAIEAAWKKQVPNEPFEYSFLDQDFQKNYEADNRRARMINSFTIIAIIISCLGLFGLATFTAEQRTKEIGIRKILGASVYGVVTLLSKDFLKLVFIAILIASPIAWYFMHQWLQNFAYQTNLSAWAFVLTAFIAMVIAFVTISFQAMKAAFSNPVKSLRTE
jgi:putative ABC transport system permease protein